MPQYRITEGWSDPIALQARDMVQNQGAFLMEICPQDPGSDATSLRLPEVTGAVQVDAAMTVRARSLGGTCTLAVIRGF